MIDLKELERIAELAVEKDSKNNFYHDVKVFDVDEFDDFVQEATPSVVRQLIKEHQEMREALEFYANGGNPNRDIWFDEKLGYFTGKRARQTLDGVSK